MSTKSVDRFQLIETGSFSTNVMQNENSVSTFCSPNHQEHDAILHYYHGFCILKRGLFIWKSKVRLRQICYTLVWLAPRKVAKGKREIHHNTLLHKGLWRSLVVVPFLYRQCGSIEIDLRWWKNSTDQLRFYDQAPKKVKGRNSQISHHTIVP